MTFEQFKYYLDAYGASLHRWPSETRAAAEAFLASSNAAVAARAEAQRLDRLLDRVVVAPDATVGARLADAAIAGARQGMHQGRFGEGLSSFTVLWSRAAVLAFACLLLGVATGTFEVNRSPVDVSWSDLAQAQAGDPPLSVAGL